MLLDSPPSVTNCHTSDHLDPLERDVIYGRPLTTTQTNPKRHEPQLIIIKAEENKP